MTDHIKDVDAELAETWPDLFCLMTTAYRPDNHTFQVVVRFPHAAVKARDIFTVTSLNDWVTDVRQAIEAVNDKHRLPTLRVV